MEISARAALERVMTELSGSETSSAVVPLWGHATPGERSSREQHIAAPADPAFASLEVRPWDDDAIGGVEIEFAPDAAPGLSDLTEWFGPFEGGPRMPSSPHVLRGEWWREGMPVRIVLLAEDTGAAGVRRLTLQRGIVPASA